MELKKTVSESFRSRANSACFWEAWVGAVLCRAGLEVTHYPFTVHGEPGALPDVGDYATSFDLTCFLPGSDPWIFQNVEVKSLSVPFVSRDSYPDEQVFVSSYNNHLKKFGCTDRLGRDYLLVSKLTGSICWVPAGSVIEVVDRYDASRNETYKAVVCPKDSLRDLGDFIQKVREDNDQD